MKNGTVAVTASEELCSLCGHCVALCPAGAIIHNMMDMENFVEVGEGESFETASFVRFLRERRSHRHFLDKAIPQNQLEELVDVCRYAPTGGNVQSVEMIIVQNPATIKRMSDLTIDFFIDMGRGAEATLNESSPSSQMAGTETLQTLVYYKNRLSSARAEGQDPIFYKAPALIIFHSDSQTRTPKDNCVIAATSMALTARTVGLESTYIGLFEVASKMNQSITEELKLPAGHEIFSVLIMGYPKLKFLRTVDRHPIKARWE